MGRFFKQAAERVDVDNPGLAHTLRRAPPHWMRHIHATHALGHAAELTTFRCQLGSCLDLDHVDLPAWDDLKRARQLSAAFLPQD